MKYIKGKWFPAVCICIALLLGLTACSGKAPAESDSGSGTSSNGTTTAASASTATSSALDSSTTETDTNGTLDTTDTSDKSAETSTTATKAPPKNSTSATTSKTKATDSTSPVKVVQSLNNTYYKLTVEKKLTVGYIGGSITVGIGASDLDKTSWRALTTQWLKKTYPSATIREGNAAIGSTGSLLGACRVGDELLDDYKPDLIFAEFAINDYYQGCLYEDSIRNMETFVRIVLKNNPNTDIVFVYTTDCGFRGKMFDAVSAFEAVAKHYGLYTINVGKELADREGAEALNLSGKYLTDSVHPNDAGHAKYSSYVTEFLSTQFKKCEKDYQPHSIPAPFRGVLFEKATLISGNEILASNSSLQSSGDLNTIRGTVRLSGGDAFTIKFKGKGLAMRWRSAVGANIVLRLDKKESTLPIGNLDNAQQVIFNDLSNTEHTLQVINKGSTICYINGFYALE